MNLQHFLTYLETRTRGAAIISSIYAEDQLRPETNTILSCWFDNEDFLSQNLIIIEEYDKQFIPIKKIREAMAELHKHATKGTRKALFIPETQRLSIQGQNALLKFIEEPPSHTFVFLGCHHPYQLLTTIRSRCVKVALLNPVQVDGHDGQSTFLGAPSPKSWLQWTEHQVDKKALRMAVINALRHYDTLSEQHMCHLMDLLESTNSFEPVKVIFEKQFRPNEKWSRQ